MNDDHLKNHLGSGVRHRQHVDPVRGTRSKIKSYQKQMNQCNRTTFAIYCTPPTRHIQPESEEYLYYVI